MCQIIGGGLMTYDLKSVGKSSTDLVIKKLDEGKIVLEKKLDFQSYDSGNHFETIIKNLGEF